MALSPCEQPTFYFIGVSTQHSSIMQVFPRWMDYLGINAVIRGHDISLRAPAAAYREIVQHIQQDPFARGALVTTHKIDLLHATRDLFAQLDTYADLCGEVSCIAKRDGQLYGYAKDPISSGLSWAAFVPPGHWDATQGAVLCLGAGGAGVSISVSASRRADAADRPSRFITVDRDATRLKKLQALHQQLETDVQFAYHLHTTAEENDTLLEKLPPGSLVINATGMGKDTPGSPIGADAVFPQNGLVWELNYRGALPFYHQALAQQTTRNLTVEDGWVYFLHGWTQVIAEVFQFDLTLETFQALDRIASELRGR